MTKKVQRRGPPNLRRIFRHFHQWSNELPGGCEACVHWRSTVESLARAGELPPVVIFNLDLANMFGTLEWPKILAAIEKHYNEASKWFEWAHRRPEEIELPGDVVAYSDRGAGQGDVFGFTASSLTLGESMYAVASDKNERGCRSGCYWLCRRMVYR